MKLLHLLLSNSADGVILHSSQWGLVGQRICGVVTDRVVLEVPAIIEKQTTFLTWNHQASPYKYTTIEAFNQYTCTL